MAVNESFATYIQDQLSEFGEVDIKKMFGGMGIFKNGKMFGMLAGDTFRLKVDEHNQADFEARGMKPYHSEKKKKGMPYWEVPQDIIDDKIALRDWAAKAYQAAERGGK